MEYFIFMKLISCFWMTFFCLNGKLALIKSIWWLHIFFKFLQQNMVKKRKKPIRAVFNYNVPFLICKGQVLTSMYLKNWLNCIFLPLFIDSPKHRYSSRKSSIVLHSSPYLLYPHLRRHIWKKKKARKNKTKMFWSLIGWANYYKLITKNLCCPICAN